MATIRAYTTIVQSRKLAEILPLESADMYYPYDLDSRKVLSIPIVKDDYCMPCIHCWSLASLLDMLPEKYTELIKEGGMYRIIIKDSFMTCLFDNPVDACYELILKLNELNLL